MVRLKFRYFLEQLMPNKALFIALMLSVFSTISAASFISNNEIERISISSPSDWTTLNAEQLFDGISDQHTVTRFAAYQNTGSLLSSDNPYQISISFFNAKEVDSISFFNDWGSTFRQQIASMNVTFYDQNNGLLWSNDYDNLKKNSWEEIKLFDFSTPIVDVKSIDFTITGSQGSYFEVRELAVSVTNEPDQPQSTPPDDEPFIPELGPPVNNVEIRELLVDANNQAYVRSSTQSVSAPHITIFVGLAALALLWRRKTIL